MVPVLIAAVVLVKVVGSPSSSSSRSGAAEVSGTTTAPRDGLPVLPVQTSPPDAAADAACPALVQALPDQVVGAASRRVASTSPYVRAWGDPAVVLVCGVARPAGFTRSAGLIQIDAVQWYVDTSDPKTVVWTAVDRSVYVQVRVPSSTDSASVTELTPHIAAALPAQQPQPGP